MNPTTRGRVSLLAGGLLLAALMLWRAVVASPVIPHAPPAPAGQARVHDAWSDGTSSWSVGPVRMRRYQSTCDDGPLRGLIARIDLTSPDLEVVVTRPLPDGAKPGEGGGGDDPRFEARLTPTDEWMDANRCILAVNCNYFGRLPADDTLVAKARGWTRNERVNIVGLSVSDHQVVSPVRVWKGRPDPSVVFGDDLVAHVGYFSDDDVAGRTDLLDHRPALAGVGGLGPSNSEPRFGSLLVERGENLGKTARTEPLKRHPRTVIGVSRDGRTLILLAVDGRLPQHSVGITLPEAAAVLIDEGVWAGVNLDGGGSTTMILQLPNGERVTNKPSDGTFRSVANQLGFRLRSSPQ